MALVINDRVRETSTTSGTGTLNLAGAVTGFRTFVDGIGNSNTTYYAIEDANGTDVEAKHDQVLQHSEADGCKVYKNGYRLDTNTRSDVLRFNITWYYERTNTTRC